MGIPFTKILIPYDFHSCSEAAFARAIDVGSPGQTELHLFHVLGETDSEAERRAVEQLEQAVPPSVTIQWKVACTALPGNPSREILQKARREKFDLIVMGTHGRSGLARLTMGSVAESVLRQAPCPVLVVREEVPLEEKEEVKIPETEDTPPLDLLRRAAGQRATDIHIDPVEEGNYLVRFRVDGRLKRYCNMHREFAERLIHQLKHLAHMDIVDTFHPKEGRLRLPPTLPNLEVRITTSPVLGGEAVALRLFSRDANSRRLDQLGFADAAFHAVQAMLRRGEGLILVSGPTGSGKTTTVYSMLETLRVKDLNIVSIEDPAEVPVRAVRQLEVDLRHGISMTSGLRTLLRMDPDVIFLGEIRDSEAVEIAMRAASSGKYVISTLHTRDIVGTITALRDLHVDMRSLASNLTGIISQRLVRRLCPSCREPFQPNEDRQRLVSDTGWSLPDVVHGPKGCPECQGTGYRGRIGVFEVVALEPALANAIVSQAGEAELRQVIRQCGTKSLTEDALLKLQAGLTSLEEVLEMRWL